MKPFGTSGHEHGIIGTDAERQGYTPRADELPLLFKTTDNGIWWNNGSWHQLTTSAGLPFIAIPSPAPMTEAQRDGLDPDVVDLYFGYSINNTDTGYENVYEGDSTTNVPADWRLGQRFSAGSAHVVITDSTGVVLGDEYPTIEVIPASTVIADPITAASPIYTPGYTSLALRVLITDVTQVGNLAGDVKIRLSDDAVNYTPYITVASLSDIGADDTQILMVDLTAYLAYATYIGVQLDMSAGTLGDATVQITAKPKRLRF